MMRMTERIWTFTIMFERSKEPGSLFFWSLGRNTGEMRQSYSTIKVKFKFKS